VQLVESGTGLTGGPITTTGTLSVDGGTTTGKIVHVAAGNKLPAIDGSDLTNIKAVKIQSRDIAATAPNDTEVLMWNQSANAWEPQPIPSAPVSSVAGKTGAVTLDVGDIGSAAGKYFTYAPNNVACGNQQILKWNGSAWLCADDDNAGGDIEEVVAGTGLSGGGTSGVVTVDLDDTGVTAQSYGSATAVAKFTVDAQGRLTAASEETIAIPTTALTQTG